MIVSFFKQLGVKWTRGLPNMPLQNGKRPEDGPPDLDQLWRDFNQRLSKLVNNKGPGDNGGGGNGFQPDMKGASIGAGIMLLFFMFLWGVSGFFMVQEGQNGVVLTLGKFSHLAPSGFHWRAPYPIQTHEVVNVSQVRTVEIGYRGTIRSNQPRDSSSLREALMLTDDENIIDIQFAVQYKLKKPEDWLFNNRDPEESLRQVAETSIREVVGKSKMDFVLYEGREKVALDVSQLMQQILDRYKTGVIIANVTMQTVQPPAQVQDAFDDAVKAGQDRERLKSEGQAYANDVVPKAIGAAFASVKDAEAYRSRVIETASGDAARFKQVVAEYQKAPTVTRDRLYLETMQQMFTNVTKVMVDTKSGNNLLSLPLDKMMSQSAINEAAKSAPQAAPLIVPESSSSDGLRRDTRNRDVRDRENR
jgi:modulator of FtsH protease HflK